MQIVTNMQDTAPMSQILQRVMQISETSFYTYQFSNDTHFLCENLRDWLTKPEQDTIEAGGLFALLAVQRIETMRKEINIALAARQQTIAFKEHIGLDKKGMCIFKIQIDFNYGALGKPASFLVIIHDITAQEKAKTLLLDKKNIAERYAQFRARQIAHMSHEIRTPMGGILGMADVLLSEPHSAKTIEKLNIIKQSSENMMNTLTTTLDHCKIMSSGICLKPMRVSPLELLRSTCGLWHDKAVQGGVKLSYQISPDLPEYISMDAYRIKQCLNNLLSNALKFAPRGKVVISMKPLTSPDTPTRLLLVVSDDGIGMTAKQQRRIFEPFAQADDDTEHAFGGTGLGMSIIQKIIKTMNGHVVLKSKTNVGTAVGLVVPLVKAVAAEDVRIRSENHNIIAQDNEPIRDLDTVLIVDDIPTNRKVLEYMLRDKFSHIVMAENGQEALDTLKKQPIDLVLMDIHMPVLSGIDATRKIRNSDTPYKDIPIIAVTADEEYHKRISRKSVGFDAVIGKPISRQKLFEAIDEHLSQPKRFRQNAVKISA